MKTSILKKCAGILVLLATLVSAAHGFSATESPPDLKLRVAKDKDLWLKLEFERWMSKRLGDAAAQIAPRESTYVAVEVVMFKENHAKQRQQRMVLEKFDISVPTLEPTDVERSWFENIDRIEIEITSTETLSADRRVALAQMPMHIFNFVQPSQIQVEIKTVARPPDVWITADRLLYLLTILCGFTMMLLMVTYLKSFSESFKVMANAPMWNRTRNDDIVLPPLAFQPAASILPGTFDTHRRLAATNTSAYLVSDVFAAMQILDPHDENHPVDSELMDFIIGADVETALAHAAANRELGAVFLNLLQPQVLSAVIEHMSSKQLQDFTNTSREVAAQPWKEVATPLKKQAKEIYGKVGAPHLFLERSLEFLGQMDAEKESVVYESFLKAGRLDLIDKAMDRFFPGQLIALLPEFVLNMALRALPSDQQVEFLHYLPEQDRETYLNALGDPHEALRSYIEFELERNAKNPNHATFSAEKAKALRNQFVNLIRGILNSNHEAKAAATDITQEWSTRLKNNKNLPKVKHNAA